MKGVAVNTVIRYARSVADQTIGTACLVPAHYCYRGRGKSLLQIYLVLFYEYRFMNRCLFI